MSPRGKGEDLLLVREASRLLDGFRLFVEVVVLIGRRKVRLVSACRVVRFNATIGVGGLERTCVPNVHDGGDSHAVGT